MSDKPIIFTEAEQISIRELERSGNDFLNYKKLILTSTFLGDNAPTVLGLANFLEGLIQQTNTQLNAIHQQAELRSKTPPALEEPKKDPTHGKKTK